MTARSLVSFVSLAALVMAPFTAEAAGVGRGGGGAGGRGGAPHSGAAGPRGGISPVAATRGATPVAAATTPRGAARGAAPAAAPGTRGTTPAAHGTAPAAAPGTAAPAAAPGVPQNVTVNRTVNTTYNTNYNTNYNGRYGGWGNGGWGYSGWGYAGWRGGCPGCWIAAGAGLFIGGAVIGTMLAIPQTVYVYPVATTGVPVITGPPEPVLAYTAAPAFVDKRTGYTCSLRSVQRGGTPEQAPYIYTAKFCMIGGQWTEFQSAPNA